MIFFIDLDSFVWDIFVSQVNKSSRELVSTDINIDIVMWVRSSEVGYLRLNSIPVSSIIVIKGDNLGWFLETKCIKTDQCARMISYRG